MLKPAGRFPSHLLTPLYSRTSLVLHRPSIRAAHRLGLHTNKIPSNTKLVFALSKATEEGYNYPLDVDLDLWEVLELCDQDELELIHETLFSPRLFSPLVKTLVAEREPANVLHQGRTTVMHTIHTRFRFLAASSLETLRGGRPTYRETLMHIRTRLGVSCPAHLETTDLETEVYLHLLSNCRQFISGQPVRTDIVNVFNSGDGMSSATSSGPFSKMLAPAKLGGKELLSMISKLGGAVSVSAVRRSLLERLGMDIIAKNASYQAALKAAYQHGLQSLRRRAGLEMSQKGITRAVARYSTANTALGILGPLLWAWLAADVMLKAIGTDYARIIKTVFSLAQIRLVKTYGFASPKTNF